MRTDIVNLINSSYRSPQLKLQFIDEKNIFAIYRIWGSQDIENQFKEIILQSFDNVVLSDQDATQVLSKKNISNNIIPVHHKLSNAITSLNDLLLTTENQRVWNTALEILLLQVEGDMVSWCQSGGIQLLINFNKNITPLCVSNINLLENSNQSPIPLHGLGMDPYPTLNSGFDIIKPGVEIFALTFDGILNEILQMEFSFESDFKNQL